MAVSPLRLTLLSTAALTTVMAGLIPISAAHAAGTVDAAASAFGVSSYSTQEITGSGDITAELKAKALSSASADSPVFVHLPSGAFVVKMPIRIASNVYLVAEDGTTVTWGGAAGPVINFRDVTNTGMYGGTWSAAHRSGDTNVINVAASRVKLAHLATKDANRHGIGGYASSVIELDDVESSSNTLNGVYLEHSTLDAKNVRAFNNGRNGIQISDGSKGTVADSNLHHNGQLVSGTTDGKVGHGIGIAGSKATVTNSTLAWNKVCGVSLFGGGDVTVIGSHMDNNGRHGLGSVPGTTGTVINTTATNNRYNGILVSGARTRITLQGVSISGSRQYGLSVPGGEAIVSGTTITGSGKINLSVSQKGAATLAEGSVITGAKSNGISISESSKLTVIGANNIVKANRGHGLSVTGRGTSATIKQAIRFEANRKDGIRVSANAKLATVKNVFVSNGGQLAKSSGGKVSAVR